MPAEQAPEAELLAPEDAASAMDPASVVDAASVVDPGFRVELANFEGPFDLLLSLIAKHELDITEVSLSRVTDEFIAHLAAMEEYELDVASEFIVVAATLLDMKIVSLLPQGDYVDAEDVAVLEARDLLFARLLQYRAFKEASAWLSGRLEAEAGRHARSVPLEARFRERAPELVWTLSAEDFAALAAIALAPREIPTVRLDHLHAPLVSIREQAAVLVDRLREAGRPMGFAELIADADVKGVVVARFLAVLELYRRAAISFEQDSPLGELRIEWDAAQWSDDDLGTLGGDE
ncbi:Segregation and condensation protein A [Pseudoclavibacter triregionum]|nr:Segregation and condensation protein A [Pseudoclavibacter triregionum]